jgi:hypothetical protein
MQVEKQIAFKIRDQFPGLYREFGSELIDFVEEYYRFLEESTDQSHYNARRLFEYRDVSTTLSELVLQFHKMFMADLPLLADSDVRFVVKNIMDLYRRKGTPGGILLFFRMFYQEDVEIKYPASQMFKPSDSDWRKGVYLQLFPNDNDFSDIDGNRFSYSDLIGKNIRGSISEARAAVDKINFILLNGTLTPVIYISNVKGNFIKYDDLLATIKGNEVAFGRINGSASSLEIDLSYGGETDQKVGDILNIVGNGNGGKAIVTDLEDEFSGQVVYTIIDKGFGYTEENTRLRVSSQNLILSNPDLEFNIEERISDSNTQINNTGNLGIVTGQSAFAVGIHFANTQHYWDSDNIPQLFAIDRVGAPRVGLPGSIGNTGPVTSITANNTSSPGLLYPDTGANTDVRVEIDNVQSVSLITDKIANFIQTSVTYPEGLASGDVALNSSNFNDSPPAGAPMSGNTDPITLATPINEAFNLEPFNIGSINNLINVNPGQDYVTDVWSIARDDVMSAFDRYEQVVVLEEVSAAMSIGDSISQANTGLNSNTTITGIITGINSSENFIKARPFSYYGFEGSNAGGIVHKGNEYPVVYVARDYTASKLGASADINSRTIFASGRVKSANVYESGFGYIDGERVDLTNDAGDIIAQAILTADTQGLTSGYWASYSSHLNGYWTDEDSGNFEYFDANMKIQDSDYYQEYSYEIKGTISKSVYEEPLKRTVHLAGTKLFGDFLHKRKMSFGKGAGIDFKFNQIIKLDDEVGGAPIVGPGQIIAGDGGLLDASTQEYTADTILLSADMTQEP